MQFQWSMLRTLFFDLLLLLSLLPLLLMLLLLFDPLVFYARAGHTICFSFGRGRTKTNPWVVEGQEATCCRGWYSTPTGILGQYN